MLTYILLSIMALHYIKPSNCLYSWKGNFLLFLQEKSGERKKPVASFLV